MSELGRHIGSLEVAKAGIGWDIEALEALAQAEKESDSDDESEREVETMTAAQL